VVAEDIGAAVLGHRHEITIGSAWERAGLEDFRAANLIATVVRPF
jgi:hypothetical protein